jgi:hypothetical protein
MGKASKGDSKSDREEPYVLAGKAVRISKFKVQSDAYVTWIDFQCSRREDDGMALEAEEAEEEVLPPVMAEIHTDLCAEIVGMPAAECAEVLKQLHKKIAKQKRNEFAMKFEHFQGKFWAQTNESTVPHSLTQVTDGSSLSGDASGKKRAANAGPNAGHLGADANANANAGQAEQKPLITLLRRAE